MRSPPSSGTSRTASCARTDALRGGGAPGYRADDREPSRVVDAVGRGHPDRRGRRPGGRRDRSRRGRHPLRAEPRRAGHRGGRRAGGADGVRVRRPRRARAPGRRRAAGRCGSTGTRRVGSSAGWTPTAPRSASSGPTPGGWPHRSPPPVRGRCSATASTVRWSTVEDAGGAVSRMEWDGLGRLVAMTNPAGTTVRHRYDGLGRLVSTTDGCGAELRREHDAEGRVVALVDGEGGVVRREHDAVGRLVAEIDADGAATRFEHDRCGRARLDHRPVGSDDDAGPRCGRSGRRRDRIRMVRRPGTAGRPAAACARSRRPTVRSPGTATTVPAGSCRSAVPGGSRTYERDAAGRVVAVTTGSRRPYVARARRVRPGGRPHGRVRRRDPLDPPPDGTGRVGRGAGRGHEPVRLGPGGAARVRGRRQRCRDHLPVGRGRLPHRRDRPARRRAGAPQRPDGSHGRLDRPARPPHRPPPGPRRPPHRSPRSERGGGGPGLRSPIPGVASDRRWRAIRALGPSRWCGTRAGGSWRATGSATEYRHGKVVAQGGPFGRRTFTYDPAGQLIARRDADGRSWRWAYDACGRRVEQVSPEGTDRYRYDAAGRLLEVVRHGPRSAVTLYRYDSAGRRTHEIHGELGRLRSIRYRWDELGRLREVRRRESRRPDAVTRIELDQAGDLVVGARRPRRAGVAALPHARRGHRDVPLAGSAAGRSRHAGGRQPVPLRGERSGRAPRPVRAGADDRRRPRGDAGGRRPTGVAEGVRLDAGPRRRSRQLGGRPLGDRRRRRTGRGRWGARGHRRGCTHRRGHPRRRIDGVRIAGGADG